MGDTVNSLQTLGSLTTCTCPENPKQPIKRIKTNLGIKIMSTVTTRTTTPQLLNSWTESVFDPRPWWERWFEKPALGRAGISATSERAREGVKTTPEFDLNSRVGQGSANPLSLSCASSFCFNSDEVIKQIKSFYPEADSPKPIDFIALLLFRASSECRFSVRLLAGSVTGDLPSFWHPPPPAILPLLLS